MMQKNPSQDHGRSGAHVAGQGASSVPGPCRSFDRRRNRMERTGPHPGGHSLAEEEHEAETAAGGLTQHVLSQLLITSHPILRDCGLGQRFVHRSFF